MYVSGHLHSNSETGTNAESAKQDHQENREFCERR